jgi:hypothetical protein
MATTRSQSDRNNPMERGEDMLSLGYSLGGKPVVVSPGSSVDSLRINEVLGFLSNRVLILGFRGGGASHERTTLRQEQGKIQGKLCTVGDSLSQVHPEPSIQSGVADKIWTGAYCTEQGITGKLNCVELESTTSQSLHSG